MNISLKQKLFILIFSIVLISLGISSYIYSNSLYNYYQEESFLSTSSDLNEVKKNITEQTDRLIEVSNALVQDNNIQTVLNLISNYEDKQNYQSILFDEEKKKILENIYKNINIVDSLSFGLFDKNGDMVAVNKVSCNKKYFGTVTYDGGEAKFLDSKSNKTYKLFKYLKPTLSNIKTTSLSVYKSEFGLRYTQAIYKNNKLVGFLRIKKVFTQKNIKVIIHNLENKFSFLVGDSIIGYSKIDKDFIRNNSDEFLDKKHILQEMVVYKDNFIHSHYLKTFNNDKLYLISFYDKNKLYSKINLMYKELFVTIIISIIISMFMAFIFLKFSILNQIAKLMRNIENIKNKNYKLEIIKGDDELSQITKSFNDMAMLIKKREEQLEKSENSLKQAQYIAKLGSWEFEYKNKLVTCSDELCNILKIKGENKPQTLISLRNYIYKDDLKMFKNSFNRSQLESKEFELEHRVTKEDGTIGYVQSKAVHIYENKKIVKTVGTMLDISKIKYLEKLNQDKEQMLFQQSKMAAMGEMIGNIAHQWRQPIAVISMWANNIIVDIDMDDIEKKNLRIYANKINEQTKHLSQTIDDFRNFFSPNKEKTSFVLKNSYKKTMNLLTASFKTHNIIVIENIEEIEIKALENEFTQAILNIIKNAKDIIVELDGKKLIFVNIYKKETNVIIEIIDNGGGVPKKIIDKIFEPYFTTKHKSQGTGIGLYMTETIITKHLGGEINVENIKYNYEGIEYIGAKFIIKLPIK